MKYIKLFESDDWETEHEDEVEEPLEIKMCEELYNFLHKHDIYDKFIKNTKEFMAEISDDVNLQNYIEICLLNKNSSPISMAFSWVGTPEGFEFWNDLCVG